VKRQIDTLLAQLERVCEETPRARAYAAARLLKIPRSLQKFHDAVADFQTQLVKQGYFHLDKKPEITREQIEKTYQQHEILRTYKLVEGNDAVGTYSLVDPETNQLLYEVHCYPRFIEKSQFWGWGIQFKHYKNPRLDVVMDCQD